MKSYEKTENSPLKSAYIGNSRRTSNNTMKVLHQWTFCLILITCERLNKNPNVIWFVLVLWYINHCRLFKSIFIQINSPISTIQFNISTQFSSIWPLNRTLPLRARVDLGVMYSTAPANWAFWNWFVLNITGIARTLMRVLNELSNIYVPPPWFFSLFINNI